MENLREFYRGKTVIVVAHRLSTVKDADKIIVLDKGHVVEEGTHQELVERQGAYYTLVKINWNWETKESGNMEELKEEKQIELRSEEVQEIMGQVPPWIQRWGITVMAFLMVLFLGISWFFKFPQSLNAQVTLTTATPPAELHARSSGQLDLWL